MRQEEFEPEIYRGGKYNLNSDISIVVRSFQLFLFSYVTGYALFLDCRLLGILSVKGAGHG